jgi:cytochrome b
MSPQPGSPTAVRAWDLPTRLFHWTLVVLIVFGWVSYEYAEALGDVDLVWHRWNGLAALTLIVWRMLWGVAGSSTARFTSFVRAPAAAMSYARALIGGRLPRYLGHNPLGAYMVLALLAAVAVHGSLGLFAVDDNDLTGGPLYRLVSEATNKWATRWHAWSFNYVIVTLVAIHVTANALYGLVKKEPLIRAMITGEKPGGDYEDAAEAAIVARPLARAAVCLVIAAAIVTGTILALGGKLP